MTSAMDEGDIEAFNSLDETRTLYWENCLRQQFDLIKFGGFAYDDVQKVPLVERDKFMEMTIERKKESDETAQSYLAMLALTSKGRL